MTIDAGLTGNGNGTGTGPGGLCGATTGACGAPYPSSEIGSAAGEPYPSSTGAAGTP